MLADGVENSKNNNSTGHLANRLGDLDLNFRLEDNFSLSTEFKTLLDSFSHSDDPKSKVSSGGSSKSCGTSDSLESATYSPLGEVCIMQSIPEEEEEEDSEGSQIPVTCSKGIIKQSSASTTNDTINADTILFEKGTLMGKTKSVTWNKDNIATYCSDHGDYSQDEHSDSLLSQDDVIQEEEEDSVEEGDEDEVEFVNNQVNNKVEDIEESVDNDTVMEEEVESREAEPETELFKEDEQLNPESTHTLQPLESSSIPEQRETLDSCSSSCMSTPTAAFSETPTINYPFHHEAYSEDKTETSSITSNNSILTSPFVKSPSRFSMFTRHLKNTMKRTLSSASVYAMSSGRSIPNPSASHTRLSEYNSMMERMKQESTGITTWAKKQEILGPPRSLSGLSKTTKLQRVSDKYPEQFQRLCDVLSDADRFVLADYLLSACGDDTLAISNFLSDRPQSTRPLAGDLSTTTFDKKVVPANRPHSISLSQFPPPTFFRPPRTSSISIRKCKNSDSAVDLPSLSVNETKLGKSKGFFAFGRKSIGS